MFFLRGKKVLVVRADHETVIAWRCAKAIRGGQGAELEITDLNQKAGRHIRPIAAELPVEAITPLEMSDKVRSIAHGSAVHGLRASS